MKITSKSPVPSTAALVVSANVGAGKSLYHKLFEEVMGMLFYATASLDLEIFHSVEEGDPNFTNTQESIDVMMLSGVLNTEEKKGRKFKRRQM